MPDKKDTEQQPQTTVVQTPKPENPNSMPGETAPKMVIRESVDIEKQKN